MSTPIDLSDALKTPPPTPQHQGPAGSGRGTGFRIDDYAQTVMWIAVSVSALLLLYLFYGLYGGKWANPAFNALPHPDRLRQLDNIGLIFGWLRISLLVMTVCMLICSFQDTSIGYFLVGIAAVFYAGLPFVTSVVYDWVHYRPSVASHTLLQDFTTLAWLFGIPGILWILWDVARRFGSASEAAAIQRAKLKYGSNVGKQPVAKQRQIFLGRCWEGPYCRDHIRERCPIFLKKRGPCWWYKEGCMCEEHIVLQAVISTDWKKQTAMADQRLRPNAPHFEGLGPVRRSHLSPAAKRERCRNCIIYNEHQRQKYKALLSLTLIAIPALLFWKAAMLENIVGQLLSVIDTVVTRFSFGDSANKADFLHPGQLSVLAWFLAICLVVIFLSQVLKFIEFCCFKLKI